MKVRDVVKRIERDGWPLVAGGKGSHRKFHHPTKPGQVIIAGHDGDDMPTGTLARVFKQAGIRQ